MILQLLYRIQKKLIAHPCYFGVWIVVVVYGIEKTYLIDGFGLEFLNSQMCCIFVKTPPRTHQSVPP